jgi:hypothetical protein
MPFQQGEAKLEFQRDASLRTVEEAAQSEVDSHPEAAPCMHDLRSKGLASTRGRVFASWIMDASGSFVNFNQQQSSNISVEREVATKETRMVEALPTSIWHD